MGQTLTHGIYLPDEGERNCYNGLAANWSILDGAVGTVAEHTSALAGKAPLVHTHTKADITDLFNSANTWSGEQTFSVPCKTLGKKLLTGITDLDDAYYNGEVCGFNPNTLHNPTGGYGNVLTINNAVNIPDSVYNSWITQIATSTDGFYLGIRHRSNGGAWSSWTRILTETNAIPTVTNTYDLGSSSYQWNNLYAKNYYYNGTAWGLDKANTWTQDQSIVANTNHSYVIKNTSYTIGEATPSSNKVLGTLLFKDSGGANAGFFDLTHYSDGFVNCRILTRYKFKNGVKDTTGTQVQSGIDVGLTDSGSKFVRPISSGDIDLGTSGKQWKTLNGVNPGALSLPKIVAKNTANIASAIVGSDGETQYLDGTDNYYTAALDGWISMCISGFTQDNQLWITVYDVRNETWGTSAESSTSARNTLFIIFPIRANQRMRFRMKCTAVDYARFYPCEGNV